MRRYSRAALLIVFGSLLGLGVTSLWPQALVHGVLPSFRPFGPRHVVGLVTYPFMAAGLLAWAWPALLILLASRLLRPEAGEKAQAVLALLGALVGGAAFVALESEARTFAGAGFVAWSFTGAGVAFALMRWAELSWPWRIYAVVFLLGLADAAFVWTSVYAGQNLSAAAGVLFMLAWTGRERSPEAGASWEEEAPASTG